MGNPIDIILDETSVLNWKDLKIAIDPVEALVLLGIKTDQGWGKKRLEILSDEQKSQLRHIIYCAEQSLICDNMLIFSLEQLKQIEDSLPLYGTIDESIYAPIRMKISNGILAINSVLFTEIETKQGGKKDVYPDDNPCQNSSKESSSKPNSRSCKKT